MDKKQSLSVERDGDHPSVMDFETIRCPRPMDPPHFTPMHAMPGLLYSNFVQIGGLSPAISESTYVATNSAVRLVYFER